MTFREQIAYRAKAILTALGVSIISLLTWLVTSPDTAATLQQLVPTPWAQLVPLLIAGIGATLLVNRVPNRTPTILTRTAGDDELIEQPNLDTHAVQRLTSESDGVEAGGGR